MRFHKPVGILLLWLPTAWALWIANQGTPSLALLSYFLLGTLFMRAAGCVVNDLADRHIDKHVHRTRMRPITTGEIGVPEALILLLGLLLCSLYIVLQLPMRCFYEALIALAITLIYPFCKRFFQAPQLMLGLAFSMGIPMAFTASGKTLNDTMIILFALNFFWIVAYDTLYAMADRVDDLRIGVKSTAILFAPYDRLIVLLLQMITHGLWLFLALRLHYSLGFFVCWGIAITVLVYQHYLLQLNQESAYLKAFSSNVWYGLLMWLALMWG
jgi:4-hydroxybenzoate polyprenyltransferase